MANKQLLRLILLSLLIALAIRAFIFYGRTLPISDGGLWLVVAETILDHSFRLPLTIHFNGETVPYCYPPLGPYLLALIHALTGISLLTLIAFLPPMLNLFAVAAFAIFITSYAKDRRIALLAVVLFPLSIQSYEIFLAGGGVTRNLGLIFQLLSWGLIYRLSPTPSISSSMRIGLLNGLAILSHPTGALWSTLGIIMAWAFEKRISFRTLLSIGAISLFVIAPWLSQVLAGNGLMPFLQAFQVSGNEMFSWQALGMPERFMLPRQFLGALALFGTFVLIRDKRALIPALLIFALLLDHRGLFVLNGVVIGVAAAAYGCMALFDLLADDHPGAATRISIAQQSFIGILILHLLISNAAFLKSFHGPTLRPTIAEIDAYQIYNESAPAGTHLLYLRSGTRYSETGEWLSVLSKRSIAPLPQGAEWSGRYGVEITALQKIAHCCDTGSWQCIKDTVANFDIKFDQIAVHQPSCGLLLDQLPANTERVDVGILSVLSHIP